MGSELQLYKLETCDASLPERIFPDHEKIFTCIQCGTCTASCPTARFMKDSPRKLIRMIQLGMKDALLASDSFWYCTTCYSCTNRCPRGISVTETMQALKRMALVAGVETKRRSSRFYTAFMKSVYRTGRMQEAEVVARWLLSTNPFIAFSFAGMGIALLRRGKMPIVPRSIEGVDQIQAMLDKAEELEKQKEVAS